ncbi:MAG TPA: 30S ribosomal protein S20 [Myxococcaceae bacterium]|nr:30S ribosomal protein S20 [Myxococcaceae bacterium]
MANTKSAQKRNRQAQRRRARNQAVRTQVKSAVKRAREALAAKDPAKAQEALRAAARTLDKAASKGVLHKKNASRRIARLFHAAQA